MQNLLLKNANVVSQNETIENIFLLIENGKISKITKAEINFRKYN